MKTMNSNKFVLDLDSSMNSAQGLLSFMTDASKQIKTFLDDNNEAKTKVNIFIFLICKFFIFLSIFF